MIFLPNSNHSYHSARIRVEYVGEGKALIGQGIAGKKVVEKKVKDLSRKGRRIRTRKRTKKREKARVKQRKQPQL